MRTYRRSGDKHWGVGTHIESRDTHEELEHTWGIETLGTQTEWRYIQKEDIGFTWRRDIYVVGIHTGSEDTYGEWRNI